MIHLRRRTCWHDKPSFGPRSQGKDTVVELVDNHIFLTRLRMNIRRPHRSYNFLPLSVLASAIPEHPIASILNMP